MRKIVVHVVDQEDFFVARDVLNHFISLVLTLLSMKMIYPKIHGMHHHGFVTDSGIVIPVEHYEIHPHEAIIVSSKNSSTK